MYQSMYKVQTADQTRDKFDPKFIVFSDLLKAENDSIKIR